MIQSTMKCVAIALCVLLAACTTDVYEPKPDPVPPTPEKPDPSLPNDFNQSTATIRQMTLTVEVNDEFNGQYDYLADQKAHNESMYLSAAENKDKYSEARYAGKMDAYRDIFDMMKKMKLE